MKEGKLSVEELRSIVFSNIKSFNKEVLVGSDIGEDCAVLDFGDYACIMSTDPITGAEKGAGALAVHISCNDVASNGIKPIALLITIMVPVSYTEEGVSRIMKEACEAAAELEVDIIGGHTEVTSAVNRPVISTTAIGKVLKSKMVKTAAAAAGDDLIMTKLAGLEGTAIIASDREYELRQVLSDEELNTAKGFYKSISVVKEGVLAGEFGVNSMHDVTEGGILGAAWEVAECAGLGLELYLDEVEVHPVTRKICMHYNINPYRLISSGCMLITTERGDELVKLLEKNGIYARIIGKMTAEGRYICQNGNSYELEPPDVDELFKL
ncbi:MAG: AIR synthase family protein [Bacillota bacterium]